MTSVVGIFILMILIMVLELANAVEISHETATVNVSDTLQATIDDLEVSVAHLKAQLDLLDKQPAETGEVNAFNQQQKLAEQEQLIRELVDRMTRTEATIQDIEQSVTEANRIHDNVLAEAASMQSDRQEVESLLRKREEIKKFATILETDHPVVYRDQTNEGRYVVLIRLERRSIWVSDAVGNVSHEFLGGDRMAKLENWLSTTDLSSRQILLIVKPSGVDEYEKVALALENSGAIFGFDVAAEDASFLLRSQIEGLP